MKNETEFKLIDGIFSSDEAANILAALFDYKIDYHNREDFSNHIRFNKDLSHSKHRIDELITAKEAIKKLIDESKFSASNLVIKSTVTISLEK
ncbi:hypothetical protein SAMN05444372_11745 [Flavobacterium micromati]|jgi:hypothetical protein|uniref:Uncharacterized protein n=1 Tax=Flavobacterium micromati TaxID=229205 RepID=A0A1M5QK51_9FLAO|nr:hypothetical protein [Flavobacterium micromati]MCL6460854.1 hypothetical protein [Flavobacterium micromati]SHH14296.1 hypothetical protein SAMN05444372_11745 [Flavobacterium micromati]